MTFWWLANDFLMTLLWLYNDLLMTRSWLDSDLMTWMTCSWLDNLVMTHISSWNVKSNKMKSAKLTLYALHWITALQISMLLKTMKIFMFHNVKSHFLKIAWDITPSSWTHLLPNCVLLNTQIGQMTLIVINARIIQLDKNYF